MRSSGASASIHAARDRLAGPRVHPARARGQVDPPRPLPCTAPAPPAGRGRTGTGRRCRTAQRRRGNRRTAAASAALPFRMASLHLLHDVGPQALAQEQQLPDDAVGLLAEGPDLVAGARARARTRGSRTPCRRNSGQKTPYWNQRTSSSRKSGSSMSPPRKPPMSVVHQGMPLMADVQPGPDLLAAGLEGGVDVARPDGGAVAAGCRPRRERHRLMSSSSPAAFMPS